VTRPGGKVAAGFFSFTEITDPGEHRRYNEWHQLDHMPEQMPLDGIAFGQRWVATPLCRSVAHSHDAGLSAAHYLTIYLMLPPVAESARAFFDLAKKLHAKERFFAHRRAITGGPMEITDAGAAERVLVSAAAVPYRPNRGIYVVIGGAPTAGAAIQNLLRVPGVAGAWNFAPGGPGGSVEPPRGAGTRGDGDVMVCYLDEDPVATAPLIEAVLAPSWDSGVSRPNFAGPFETITPWRWDWFDTDSCTAATSEGDG
jgi:hypothetical protein